MADPFDEFEFQPLTEGLGFHKKNKKQAAPVNNEMPFISKNLEISKNHEMNLPKSLELNLDMIENESPLQPPLPRNESKVQFKEPFMEDSSAAVEEILQTLRTKQVEQTKPNVVPKTAPAIKYSNSIQNMSAFFLDSMLVLAATLLCMIVVLSVTKVDISSTLLSSEAGLDVYLATLALFAVVSFIYLVVHRMFLGATPGEWAYDQRVGTPEEVGSARYALTVTLRGLLIVATGIITLPIISMITKKDIAGRMSGTQLLERT